MNSIKVRTVLDWETLKNVKNIQFFLEFANFYYYFIENFSKIIASLIALTWKNMKFDFISAYQQAFNYLKKQFTKVSILQYFDFELSYVIESDLFDYIFASILS